MHKLYYNFILLYANQEIHENACFKVELNGEMPSCHYQNSYNVVEDCSPIADSGIQSIADSPPADPFTPPTPYIPPPPVGFEKTIFMNMKIFGLSNK